MYYIMSSSMHIKRLTYNLDKSETMHQMILDSSFQKPTPSVGSGLSSLADRSSQAPAIAAAS